MRFLVVVGSVVHGAVVEARFVDRTLACATVAVVEIGERGFAIAAPGQVSMSRDAAPTSDSTSAAARRSPQETIGHETFVKPQHRDGAYGRLGAIEALPAAGTGVVGDKAAGVSSRSISIALA